MTIRQFMTACKNVIPKSNGEQRIIDFAQKALKTKSEIEKFLNSTEQIKTFELPDGFYYTVEKLNSGYGFGSAGFDTVFKSKKSMLEWIDDDLKELLLSTINEDYREVV